MHFVNAAILAVVTLAGVPVLASPLSSAEVATLREVDPKLPGGYPSEAALSLARRIGAEGNVDGLRALVAMRHPYLLSTATQSFNLDGARMLPEPVEALIVEHYADREVGRFLLAIMARELDLETGRFAKYRSRRLFDLLYADLAADPPRNAQATATRIVATDLPGIEPQLIAALPRLDAAAAAEIVWFVGVRRYAPAVPALRAVQARIPLSRNVNQVLEAVDLALLRIGTPDAQQALLDRIAKLGAERDDPRAEREVAAVVTMLSQLPPDAWPDYPTLRAALPADLGPATLNAVAMLVAARKDRRGVPDLILAAGGGREPAVSALLKLGGPPDWNAARLKLEQGPADPALRHDELARSKRLLDDALASPTRHATERATAERVAEFGDARARFDRQLAAAARHRASDPARYVADTEMALRGAEGLVAASAGRDEATGYRRDTAEAYRRLAAFTRFTLREPKRAVAHYERAVALSEALPDRENGGLLERIGLADTLRFDLKDARGAQRIYERVLARKLRDPPPVNDVEAALHRVIVDWLRAEVAYLGEGRRYAGIPDREALGAIALAVLHGAESLRADDASLAAMGAVLATREARDDEKREFARKLQGLTASQARILAAFDYMPLLASPDLVAEFLRRNDPTGYLSAGAFAVWHRFEQAAAGQPAAPGMRMYTWSASDRALMRRAEAMVFGRSVTVDSLPDPALATPESTWKTFLAALRRGDLDAAWKCTTPGARNKYERGFATMTPAALKETADAIVGLERTAEYGEFVEAVIVRASARAGTVIFVRQGKEWRIQEM